MFRPKHKTYFKLSIFSSKISTYLVGKLPSDRNEMLKSNNLLDQPIFNSGRQHDARGDHRDKLGIGWENTLARVTNRK
jgi:hypothetical protein